MNISEKLKSRHEDFDGFLSYVINRERRADEMKEIYNEWANEYDQDVDMIGYEGPGKFADIFKELGFPKDAKILDGGCGTGILGKELKDRGYAEIYAFDGSSGMLNVARSKNVYKQLEECILVEGTKLPFSNDTFDAVLLCGSVGPGHIGADGFPELIRITKAGGVILWIDSNHASLPGKEEEHREYRQIFEAKVKDLIDSGKWKVYKETAEIEKCYRTETGFVRFMEVL